MSIYFQTESIYRNICCKIGIDHQNNLIQILSKYNLVYPGRFSFDNNFFDLRN